MSTYIVSKNHKPYLTTHSEEEACTLFDNLVYSGYYRQAAVHVLPKSGYGKELLLEACDEPSDFDWEERSAG